MNGTKMLPPNIYIITSQVSLRYATRHFRKSYSHLDSLDLETLRKILEKVGARDLSRMPKWQAVLFVICRVNKPRIVVETGVSRGFSSALILQALSDNCHGVLYSVDLPHPTFASSGLEPGFVVPESLRERWTLILGKSSEVLPVLLQRLGVIDIFIHDSEHTYDNMMFEYTLAWEHICPGGYLISDDAHANASFTDFCQNMGADYIIEGRCGIASK